MNMNIKVRCCTSIEKHNKCLPINHIITKTNENFDKRLSEKQIREEQQSIKMCVHYHRIVSER